MLISVERLKEYDDRFNDFSRNKLEQKLGSIESLIRKYTNNNFQNRKIRFIASSNNQELNNFSPYLKVGDTIEISNSINNGLYTIKSLENGKIKLNEDIYDSEYNLCTKIEYPLDIIDGAIELLDWKLNQSDKVGISSESETISRHSTTINYRNLNKDNTIDGYPIELFGFCNLYIKARF